MRVAILEDDTSQLELVGRWLRMDHHHVHAFQRGKALLHALERKTFDALLLDWNVPDVSGMEVLKRVRERLGSRTPVLFITARADETDVVSALRQGADRYLVKPLRRLELLAQLEAVTRRVGGEHSRLGISRSDHIEWMLSVVSCYDTTSRWYSRPRTST